MSSSTTRVGRQDQSGVRSTNMRVMGTEYVLSAADIKEHYDRLGSGLHIPTMAQFQDNKLPDPDGNRARCEEVVLVVDRVLSSSVWNNTMGNFGQIDCFRCRNPIRRRMPLGVTTLHVECFDCKAAYTIEQQEGGKLLWTPVMEEAPCANVECSETIALWPDELRPGICWTCKRCGIMSEISLRVGVKDDAGSDQLNGQQMP